MTSVFVSYASSDRERVAPLVDAMQAQGMTVWWDRHIETGTSFDRAIEQALQQASAVVVVWSAASINSDWVKAEADSALQADKLVPVRIDDVPVPMPFGRIQTADLIGWNGEPAPLADVLARVDTLAGVSEGVIRNEAPAARVQNSGRSASPISRTMLVALAAIAIALTFFVFSGDQFLPEAPVDAAGGRQVLAVLPFVNVGSDPQQQVFADGMTEEIILRWVH